MSGSAWALCCLSRYSTANDISRSSDPVRRTSSSYSARSASLPQLMPRCVPRVLLTSEITAFCPAGGRGDAMQAVVLAPREAEEPATEPASDVLESRVVVAKPEVASGASLLDPWSNECTQQGSIRTQTCRSAPRRGALHGSGSESSCQWPGGVSETVSREGSAGRTSRCLNACSSMRWISPSPEYRTLLVAASCPAAPRFHGGGRRVYVAVSPWVPCWSTTPCSSRSKRMAFRTLTRERPVSAAISAALIGASLSTA